MNKKVIASLEQKDLNFDKVLFINECRMMIPGLTENSEKWKKIIHFAFPKNGSEATDLLSPVPRKLKCLRRIGKKFTQHCKTCLMMPCLWGVQKVALNKSFLVL